MRSAKISLFVFGCLVALLVYGGVGLTAAKQSQSLRLLTVTPQVGSTWTASSAGPQTVIITGQIVFPVSLYVTDPAGRRRPAHVVLASTAEVQFTVTLDTPGEWTIRTSTRGGITSNALTFQVLPAGPSLTLTCPATATALNTNPAPVSYGCTVSGGVPPYSGPFYELIPGTVFAVGGPFPVIVTASDQNTTVTQTIQVTVVAGSTLTATCPGNVSLTSTTGGSVVGTYNLPSTSGGTLPITASENPVSGSLFPVGVTTVTGTATDSSNPQQTAFPCTFTVTVTFTPPPPPPPGSTVLTSDVTLTGSTNYTLTGTSGAHVTLACQGFRFKTTDTSWTGSLSLTYVDASNCGDSTHEALGDSAGTGGMYVNGGTITFSHVTWHTSGATNLNSQSSAVVSVTNTTWAADNVWPSSKDDEAVTGIFTEAGSSTAAKTFQGNQLFKSWAIFGSPNWLVGVASCTAGNTALSNIFIGQRAGFRMASTVSGEASCNYSHSIEQVTPTVPYWADVENFVGPGSGTNVHDNIFNAGQWMTTGIDGTLQNNVFANGGGHDYWRIGAGGTAKNNIAFGASSFNNGQRYGSGVSYTAIPGEAAAVDLIQGGNHFAVKHNTFDLTGDVEHGCVRVISGATLDAYQDNVCVGVTLGSSNSGNTIAALMPDPTEGLLGSAPNRVTVANHNETVFAANSATQLVYDITTAGGQPCSGGAGASDIGTCNGQGLNPQFRGPLPISGPYDLQGDRSAAFPFNDSDILNGTYTVADMLAWARWVYAPSATSALVAVGSDGKDIGAVDSTTLPGTAPSIVTTNKRPVVSAGPSFTTGTSIYGSDADHAELIGSGADDGLPNAGLSFQWSQLSGPGTATIDFPTRSAATATLPTCGIYVFQLAASDGVLTSTDTATITKTCPAGGHPLIWLESSRLAVLTNKVTTNEGTYAPFKAKADKLAAATIIPFNQNDGSNGSAGCDQPNTQICYAYEGTGWWDALFTLSLAYQVTGNTTYSTQAIAVVDSMISAGVAAEAVDVGFPSRFIPGGLALAYDWLYPQLGASRRAAMIALGNSYYDWAKANGLDFCVNPSGNFCGGHLFGFGLFGLATVNDNARSAEIVSYVNGFYSSLVMPAFSSGILQNGFPIEGMVYGANHLRELLDYAYAVKTATGVDTFTYATNAAKVAHGFLYFLKPNRWQFPDEADYPGSYVGVMDPGLIAMLPTLMPPGTADAMYAQWQYNHLAANPAGQVADVSGNFLWSNSALGSTDYRTVIPTARYSAGDEHLWARTDWTDSACWYSFTGLQTNEENLGTGSTNPTLTSAHQNRAAGNVELQCGNDYVLASADQWKGSTGVTGSPESFLGRSLGLNTLAYQTSWTPSDTYGGGQGYWGTNNTLAQSVQPTYSYMTADLSSSYQNTINTGLVSFIRTFVSLNDGNAVVCDAITAGHATDLHKLVWHLNPNGTPSLNGSILTTTVGLTKFQIAPFASQPLNVVIARDTVSDGDPTPTLYRMEVTDASGVTTLNVVTVLSAFPASTGTPPTLAFTGPMTVSVGGRQVACSADARTVTVGGVTNPPPPPSGPSDNFNNGGSTQNLSAYNSNWTDMIDTLRVVGNQLAPAADNNNAIAWWNGTTFTDDQHSTATLVNVQNYPGFVVRAAGTAAGFTAQGYLWLPTGGFVYKINASGSTTQIATGWSTPSAGNVCTFSVVGSLLKGVCNGVTEGTVTDTTYATGGAPGVFMNGSASPLMDDWSGGSDGGGGGGGTGGCTPAPCDNFNNAGVTQNLTAYSASWTDMQDHLQVISNQLAPATDNANAIAYWNAQSFTADQHSQATIVSTTNYPGLLVRGAGTTAGFTAQGYLWLPTIGIVYKILPSGAAVSIATGWTTNSAGDTCKFSAVGTTLTGTCQGVTMGTTTDSTYTSGGAPGVFMSSAGGSPRIDNWVAGNGG